MQAGSPGDIIFGQDGKVRIKAVAYLLMPEEVVSVETGEPTVVARTILYGADGRHWRTTSATAPHALHRILQLWSADEWAAGIEIEISERRSPKTGRTYHDMRVIYEHPAVVAG